MNLAERTYRAIMSYFPINLIFVQLKVNLFLLMFWVIIIMFIKDNLAGSYGMQYLFISPEYYDKVNFTSFFALGLSFGLFTMAFHVTSYIYLSKRFPFLATLEKPLLRFAINNSLPPVITLGIYYYQTFIFLYNVEKIPLKEILIMLLGFTLGLLLIISLIFTYFFSANKNVMDIFGKKIKDKIDRPINVLMKKEKSTEKVSEDNQQIKYYLKTPFRLKLVRFTEHYDKKVLLDTLQKHHNNGGIFMLSIILLMIILGIASNYTFLKIPAAATILLIFSLYMMILGVMHTWFKKWTFFVSVVILFAVNIYSPLFLGAKQSKAYGLSYQQDQAEYSPINFNRICNDSILDHDLRYGRETLEKWKAKNISTKDTKPKLVFINTSGGGQRSSLWTFNILTKLDSICGYDLMNKTHLITGASGGMLGATFYRQLYMLRGSQEIGLSFSKYYQQLGKDLLNPIMFTYVVNDLFYPFKKFQYNNIEYVKDRGTALEEQINRNTDFILEMPIKRMTDPEMNSEIPFMIYSPTIINDGRKLLISTMPVSYLTYNKYSNNQNRGIDEYDAVEFMRLFEKQGAENLRMMSALRMSASFPYISPIVELPSDPSISLIDAGVRDNLGFELTLRYISRFSDWIEKNTSGVIIVQIMADRAATIQIENQGYSLKNAITMPISGILKSFSTLQVYNQNQLKEYSLSNVNFDVEVLKFQLFEDIEKISLSWHLTTQEKQHILNAFSSVNNRIAAFNFKKLLEEKKKK